MDSAQPRTSPPRRANRWFQAPWVQGIGTTLGTLVPARSYPAWLRQTMMWVPAVGLGALVSSPTVWRSLAESAQAQPDSPGAEAADSARNESAEQLLDTSAADRSRRRPFTRWLGRAGGGIAVGALVYGNMRMGFWLDGAIERGLRRVHVPAPRVVMALAAGGAAVWTAKADRIRAASDS
ncbi:hypothetical protein [Nesterenkonia halotolerans]|uniref:Uncharacterized protein n=1 Tax=Nesterenkonia halotolerans TaxID=225325 RepID=A0ABR9J951_9MICC|nr:hypothetical protein [Nesterenkonia halotolerans]MBE1515518.1 hypothetical protein [Nesterenkonia halotolerans]